MILIASNRHKGTQYFTHHTFVLLNMFLWPNGHKILSEIISWKTFAKKLYERLYGPEVLISELTMLFLKVFNKLINGRKSLSVTWCLTPSKNLPIYGQLWWTLPIAHRHVWGTAAVSKKAKQRAKCWVVSVKNEFSSSCSFWRPK